MGLARVIRKQVFMADRYQRTFQQVHTQDKQAIVYRTDIITHSNIRPIRVQTII